VVFDTTIALKFSGGGTIEGTKGRGKLAKQSKGK